MVRAWLPFLLCLSACADVLGLEDPLQGSEGSGGNGGGGGGGSSPVAPRTCTGTTYEGSCYERHKAVASWMAARDQCEQDGGWLVTLQSTKEEAAIGSTMIAGDLVYVGASDLDTPGSFIWLDGSKPATDAWFPSQPDFQKDEHCGVTRNALFAFGLEDHVCNDVIDYICERPIL